MVLPPKDRLAEVRISTFTNYVFDKIRFIKIRICLTEKS